jgi:hypothetical protein
MKWLILSQQMKLFRRLEVTAAFWIVYMNQMRPSDRRRISDMRTVTASRIAQEWT